MHPQLLSGFVFRVLGAVPLHVVLQSYGHPCMLLFDALQLSTAVPEEMFIESAGRCSKTAHLHRAQ